MAENAAERREHVRIEMSDIVKCFKTSLPGDTNTGTDTAKSKNVSAGGILIESSVKYSVGDVLRLEISLPGWADFKGGVLSLFKKKSNEDGEALQVVGRVVRVETVSDSIFFVGICYTDIAKADQKAVEKYIHKMLDR